MEGGRRPKWGGGGEKDRETRQVGWQTGKEGGGKMEGQARRQGEGGSEEGKQGGRQAGKEGGREYVLLNANVRFGIQRLYKYILHTCFTSCTNDKNSKSER